MSTDMTSIAAAVHETVIGGGLFGVEGSVEQLDMLRDPETGRLPANTFQQMRARGRGRPAGSRNKASKKIAQMIVQTHGDPVMELASIGFMPLDQMVELLLVATGNSKVEERLTAMADALTAKITALPAYATKEQRESLQELAEKVFDSLRRYALKPGDLAEKAMKIKKDALKEVGPYVHGKQPIAIDVTGKPDVILNIPGLTDAAHLAQYVEGDLTDSDLENLEFATFRPVDEDDAGE
jgi:hypothetical protein